MRTTILLCASFVMLNCNPVHSEDDGLRVRYSVRQLQDKYDNGDRKPLEDLMRAWKGIKELPASDKRSFFVLAGYHGEPFQYRRAVDALDDTDRYEYWGGYCNHGNVLFPTWHRVYCLKVEEALRSIVPGVTLPYWDETSEMTLKRGIPAALTRRKFKLDGELIDNPLRSFVLPIALSDDLPGDERAYEKPVGYETVRYPLSGLVGTAADRARTAAHNAKYPDSQKNRQLLNDNVIAWLKGGSPTPENPNPKPGTSGILFQFKNCLRAPNYTVFSNTTSAKQWNLDHKGILTALEAPHNDVHLAVGGFDIPADGSPYGQVAGANGDMGENNTAAMDPIFFFHHCNVDRMFWVWQQQNGKTDKIEIIKNYAGTSSSDSQGPTPGVAPGTSLDLNTPLAPFVKDQFGNLYTSNDCINIERQMGYKYAPGSLEKPTLKSMDFSTNSTQKLVVSGIDRSLFQGSFVVRAFASVNDDTGKPLDVLLGTHSVLSRRNVKKCANCLTHLEVVAIFPLNALTPEQVGKAKFRVQFQHRGEQLPKQVNFTMKVVE